ncbi:hypothetical protein KY290_036345 [Solanum tuberosum]|uniref:Uncharacterized protein n=1 Tax=Solanum tuberosum TaxID=4113 RepID=A0ABQ7TT24_SOLTU|nr:hypothetical protein KY285_035632 [Solanum tuberosum]KAH0737640.1 hypothetical protein KY290_036345 [Solanum tuberosum]
MEDPIMDERDKMLVSPLGPNLKPPSIPFSSEFEWPLKVSFHGCNGWRDQQMKWKEWVETMEAIHHPIWKAARIYGALKCSKGGAVRLTILCFRVVKLLLLLKT